MSHIINTHGLTIEVEHTAEKANRDGFFGKNQHNTVTVLNDATGETAQFDFWGSKVEPAIDTERGAWDALTTIADDAITGENDFEGYCDEFGWPSNKKEYKEAQATVEALHENRQKFLSVYHHDLYDLVNTLRAIQDARS